MKLTTLGSGTFFISKEMSASSFVIDTGTKKLLIDCGPGTLVKLAQAGIDINDIDYVFLTHFHPDHSSDLFPLFMNYRLADIFAPSSDNKFPVFYGPKGLRKFMINYAKNSQLHSVEGWDKIEMVDYNSKMQIDDFTLKTFKVEHNAFNFKAAVYALRFEFNDKVITFSGDCASCDGVKKACKNADLFICDASFPASYKVNNVHMNTTEIAEISKEGKVKMIILDHFYPQFANYDLVKEVGNVFNGKILKAKDLDVMEF